MLLSCKENLCLWKSIVCLYAQFLKQKGVEFVAIVREIVNERTKLFVTRRGELQLLI